jgi:hypothetical protein
MFMACFDDVYDDVDGVVGVVVDDVLMMFVMF